MRPPIGLGDLARVWAALGATEVPARQAIARLLGCSFAPEAAARPRVSLQTPPSQTILQPTPQPPPPPAEPDGDVRRTLNTEERLTALPPLRVPPAVGWESVQPLPELDRPFRTPPPRPLFAGRTLRGLLIALLSQRLPSGDLDMVSLTEQLARRHFPQPLPQTTTATLRRGAWVMLDAALAAPLLEDIQQLVGVLEKTLGTSALRLWQFRGTPLRYGIAETPPDRLDPGRSWRPPPGTPVLLITDLGLTPGTPGRASKGDWRAFARDARQHPVAVLLPYTKPPDWVEALGFAIAPWSPTTTAASLQRICR
ncbi:MAG: hypothetical protein ACI8RZ_003094 [Myxococcota bacterium]|jgi:hypothetical protein